MRKVFALLATRADQMVDIDTIAEELWERRIPASAVTTIRTHVYHLRRMLAEEAGMPAVAAALTTDAAGYRLRLAPGQLDACEFDSRMDRGRRALTAGRAEEASRLLHSALALWRGAALANMPVGTVLSRYVAHLTEQRIRALELQIEADLRLARHRELMPQLRGLVAAHPLNEWFHIRLIEVLQRCGRRAEALDEIRLMRQLLADELGLELPAEVHRLQQEILSGTRFGVAV
ncbi:MAG TPA: AfsR/SARP family transcriptional regulator [Mycobacteriales bacterium]